MAEVTMQEIHEDLEVLKQDVAEMKAALLGSEGSLSEWAEQRIRFYSQKGVSERVSQTQAEDLLK